MAAAVLRFKEDGRFLGIENSPFGVGFEESVENNQEFSHTGDENDHGLFSLCFQTLGEGFDDGIVPPGGHGSHVENASDGSTAGVDASMSLEGAAVAIEGSDTDQGGNFLPVELPQFRYFSEKRTGSDLSDAGNALHEVALVLPLLIGLDELGNGVLNDLDLGIEMLDGALKAFADDEGIVGFAAIAFSNTQLKELSSARDEGIEFDLLFRHFLESARLHLESELRDDRSIDSIRFGQNVHGFGKVTHLAWVDDSDEMAMLE